MKTPMGRPRKGRGTLYGYAMSASRIRSRIKKLEAMINKKELSLKYALICKEINTLKWVLGE